MTKAVLDMVSTKSVKIYAANADKKQTHLLNSSSSLSNSSVIPSNSFAGFGMKISSNVEKLWRS